MLFRLVIILDMKYVIKDCFWIGVSWFKRKQDLDVVKEKLLSKLWTEVYNWKLDKKVYREVYEAMTYGENIEEINEVLIYELGVKIYPVWD